MSVVICGSRDPSVDVVLDYFRETREFPAREREVHETIIIEITVRSLQTETPPPIEQVQPNAIATT